MGREVETRRDEGTSQKTKQDAITPHVVAFTVVVVVVVIVVRRNKSMTYLERAQLLRICLPSSPG